MRSDQHHAGSTPHRTLVEIDEASFTAVPPPLPLTLCRKKPPVAEDAAWLAQLPKEARAVLDAARRPAERWPFAPRVPGAVVLPVTPRSKN